jgi:hypothetical protein
MSAEGGSGGRRRRPREAGWLARRGRYVPASRVGRTACEHNVPGGLQVTSTEDGGGTLVTVRASLDDSIAFPGLERLP